MVARERLNFKLYLHCLFVEYRISRSQHTQSSYHVKVQYTKTEIHCIVGKPEGDLHSSKCVILKTIYFYFYEGALISP